MAKIKVERFMITEQNSDAFEMALQSCELKYFTEDYRNGSKFFLVSYREAYELYQLGVFFERTRNWKTQNL